MMDVGRLGSAVEAGNYASAWEADKQPGADHDDKLKAGELLQLARKMKRAQSH